MHVELSPVMHVRLRFAVVCVVGRGQKPWQIKLPLIQYPSLDLVVGFSPVFLMLPLYLLGVNSHGPAFGASGRFEAPPA